MKNKIDDFIGTKFKISEGSTITVLKYLPVIKGKRRKYVCECSVCSRDYKLFPKGSIQATKKSLKLGHSPCGCSGHYKYSCEQNKERVLRKCEELGYIFSGFYGKYSGVKTYLYLYNAITKNSWNTTTIDKLLNGRGDPAAGYLKTKKARIKTDEYHIKDFISAGFSTEDKFTRNSERKAKDGGLPYWDLQCHICSQDEYVEAGLCSGVFTSTAGSLKKGLKPCRCSVKYNWNRDQRVYQINKICSLEGFKFLRWEDEDVYKGKYDKFYWECSKGHLCKSSIGTFLNQGCRCKTCAENEWGLYKHKIKDKDTLYFLQFKYT